MVSNQSAEPEKDIESFKLAVAKLDAVLETNNEPLEHNNYMESALTFKDIRNHVLNFLDVRTEPIIFNKFSSGFESYRRKNPDLSFFLKRGGFDSWTSLLAKLVDTKDIEILQVTKKVDGIRKQEMRVLPTLDSRKWKWLFDSGYVEDKGVSTSIFSVKAIEKQNLVQHPKIHRNGATSTPVGGLSLPRKRSLTRSPRKAKRVKVSSRDKELEKPIPANIKNIIDLTSTPLELAQMLSHVDDWLDVQIKQEGCSKTKETLKQANTVQKLANPVKLGTLSPTNPYDAAPRCLQSSNRYDAVPNLKTSANVEPLTPANRYDALPFALDKTPTSEQVAIEKNNGSITQGAYPQNGQSESTAVIPGINHKQVPPTRHPAREALAKKASLLRAMRGQPENPYSKPNTKFQKVFTKHRIQSKTPAKLPFKPKILSVNSNKVKSKALTPTNRYDAASLPDSHSMTKEKVPVQTARNRKAVIPRRVEKASVGHSQRDALAKRLTKLEARLAKLRAQKGLPVKPFSKKAILTSKSKLQGRSNPARSRSRSISNRYDAAPKDTKSLQNVKTDVKAQKPAAPVRHPAREALAKRKQLQRARTGQPENPFSKPVIVSKCSKKPKLLKNPVKFTNKTSRYNNGRQSLKARKKTISSSVQKLTSIPKGVAQGKSQILKPSSGFANKVKNSVAKATALTAKNNVNVASSAVGQPKPAAPTRHPAREALAKRKRLLRAQTGLPENPYSKPRKVLPLQIRKVSAPINPVKPTTLVSKNRHKAGPRGSYSHNNKTGSAAKKKTRSISTTHVPGKLKSNVSKIPVNAVQRFSQSPTPPTVYPKQIAPKRHPARQAIADRKRLERAKAGKPENPYSKQRAMMPLKTRKKSVVTKLVNPITTTSQSRGTVRNSHLKQKGMGVSALQKSFAPTANARLTTYNSKPKFNTKMPLNSTVPQINKVLTKHPASQTIPSTMHPPQIPPKRHPAREALAKRKMLERSQTGQPENPYSRPMKGQPLKTRKSGFLDPAKSLGLGAKKFSKQNLIGSGLKKAVGLPEGAARTKRSISGAVTGNKKVTHMKSVAFSANPPSPIANFAKGHQKPAPPKRHPSREAIAVSKRLMRARAGQPENPFSKPRNIPKKSWKPPAIPSIVKVKYPKVTATASNPVYLRKSANIPNTPQETNPQIGTSRPVQRAAVTISSAEPKSSKQSVRINIVKTPSSLPDGYQGAGYGKHSHRKNDTGGATKKTVIPLGAARSDPYRHGPPKYSLT